MEHEFVTIGEASRLLRQTDVVVMRMIKDALQAGFQPEEIMKKEQRGERIMILVSRKFLLGELEHEQPQESQDVTKSDVGQKPQENKQKSGFNQDAAEFQGASVLAAKDEMIAILQKIVDTKDRHIEGLSRKIDQLIERDHETNILLKGLQDRIFLLEQGAPQTEEEQGSAKKKKQE